MQYSSPTFQISVKKKKKMNRNNKTTHGVVGNRALVGGRFDISSSRFTSEISEFERPPDIAENKAKNHTIQISRRFISENWSETSSIDVQGFSTSRETDRQTDRQISVDRCINW